MDFQENTFETVLNQSDATYLIFLSDEEIIRFHVPMAEIFAMELHFGLPKRKDSFNTTPETRFKVLGCNPLTCIFPSPTLRN
jgi:hypothetical protein